MKKRPRFLETKMISPEVCHSFRHGGRASAVNISFEGMDLVHGLKSLFREIAQNQLPLRLKDADEFVQDLMRLCEVVEGIDRENHVIATVFETQMFAVFDAKVSESVQKLKFQIAFRDIFFFFGNIKTGEGKSAFCKRAREMTLSRACFEYLAAQGRGLFEDHFPLPVEIVAEFQKQFLAFKYPD